MYVRSYRSSEVGEKRVFFEVFDTYRVECKHSEAGTTTQHFSNQDKQNAISCVSNDLAVVEIWFEG